MKLVVLTGAGVSAESGIPTFRGADGLWEGYSLEQVATPEAWDKDPELVQRFYNERRAVMHQVKPNQCHLELAKLEEYIDVQIITQNIDNLHERAGSSSVLHLHGELSKAKSTLNENYIVELKGTELTMKDRCPNGGQLRPFVVWFGEPVPLMDEAISIVEQADALLVVGTSLVVYPAAGLLNYTRANTPIYVIDPKKPEYNFPERVQFITKSATEGILDFKDIVLKNREV